MKWQIDRLDKKRRKWIPWNTQQSRENAENLLKDSGYEQWKDLGVFVSWRKGRNLMRIFELRE